MRKGELSQLSPYIPQHLLAAPGTPVDLAGVPVHEQGPLARCAPFMDTAARRVLPGHLLRRARILSSLQLGGARSIAWHVAAICKLNFVCVLPGHLLRRAHILSSLQLGGAWTVVT
jgi:hypothetical protein